MDENRHYSNGLVPLGGSIKQNARQASFTDVSLVVYNLGTSCLRRRIVDINLASKSIFLIKPKISGWDVMEEQFQKDTSWSKDLKKSKRFVGPFSSGKIVLLQYSSFANVNANASFFFLMVKELTVYQTRYTKQALVTFYIALFDILANHMLHQESPVGV